MGKGYILVEGEVEAAGNLVSRVGHEVGCDLVWAPPLRWPALHRRESVERGANYIRTKGDAAALLLLRDEDDACPRETGPEVAGWLRALALPFPSAAVLFKPEYEVVFLPCLPQLAGRPLGEGAAARPGLRPDARWDGGWEQRRGVKELLSSMFVAGRAYKPTLDQLPLTRMLDLSVVRAAGVPCYQTLERAMAFLGGSPGQGATYPPPAPSR